MKKTASKGKAATAAAPRKAATAGPRAASVKSAKAEKTADTAARKAAGKGPAVAPKREKWPAKEMDFFRKVLYQMREQLTGQIEALKVDALTREDAVNSEEDGTDAFERQFALNIVRSESHSVAEIDDALKRLQLGSYGVCEDCGGLIGKARLAALPFVRLCIECKSKQEDGKPHFQPMEAEAAEPAREPRERE